MSLSVLHSFLMHAHLRLTFPYILITFSITYILIFSNTLTLPPCILIIIYIIIHSLTHFKLSYITIHSHTQIHLQSHTQILLHSHAHLRLSFPYILIHFQPHICNRQCRFLKLFHHMKWHKNEIK